MSQLGVCKGSGMLWPWQYTIEPFFKQNSRRHFLPIFAAISRQRATTRRFATSSAAPQNLAKIGRHIELCNLPNEIFHKLSIEPSDLTFYPDVFNEDEQGLILRTCLATLDTVLNTREARKARRQVKDLQLEPGAFLPPEAYAFERSHFDGVIDGYREAEIKHWPDQHGSLAGLLDRLYRLMPRGREPTSHPFTVPNHLLAHIIHLAADGRIDPHVDNVEASAGTILGLSLGGERVMTLRLSQKAAAEAGMSKEETSRALIKLRLIPGSVYVQRRGIRYHFEHAIPTKADFGGTANIGGTQRVSVMFRDKLQSPKIDLL